MGRFVLLFSLALSGQFANASLVELDWQTSGDAGITYDTATNLEWLDVSITANTSVNQMLPALDPGGQYDDWRYASEADINSLYEAYGLVGADYWNCYTCALDLQAQVYGGIKDGVYTRDDSFVYWVRQLRPFEDGNLIDNFPQQNLDYAHSDMGHFLVRTGAVPVPAAIWLFASGLLGLIGLSRRGIYH